MSTRRTWTAAGVGALAAALVAIVVSLSFLVGSSQPVAAVTTVDPILDFSISSTTGGQNCDSNGTPTATCTFPLNSAFTMNFTLHALGSATGWRGYDLLLAAQNLTAVKSSLTQSLAQGPGVWPDCTFPANDFTNPGGADPPQLTAACAEGPSATLSTYTGLLMHVDFQCGASNAQGSLTLIPQGPGSNGTHLVVDFADQRVEEHSESLTIVCGSLSTPTRTPTPTATRTPGGPTDTPSPTSLETPTATSTPSPTSTATPTDTPALPTTPPTATRTPTRTPRPAQLPGDVNGDGRVNTLDALWVLWLVAGMVPSVAHPENADLNHDSLIDARDAAIILQIEAGLVTLLG